MSRSKEAQSRAAKKHYQSHKEAMKARAKAFKRKACERNHAYVVGYKAAKGCARCPMRDPRCLDFHHVGEKTGNIADASGAAWSLKRLQQEIDKCIVLCANCHRIETFQ